jgi:hypothetical protein
LAKIDVYKEFFKPEEKTSRYKWEGEKYILEKEFFNPKISTLRFRESPAQDRKYIRTLN